MSPALDTAHAETTFIFSQIFSNCWSNLYVGMKNFNETQKGREKERRDTATAAILKLNTVI